MAHFFVSPEQIQGRQVIITGPDVKHINRVLRLNVGDRITIADGSGKIYNAQIVKTGRNEVNCLLSGESMLDPEPDLKVTLVQGIPKGDKMDGIIQKSVELGVARIIPLLSERVVVHLKKDKAFRRQERWQRISLEAAKQCRRAVVPVVGEPINFRGVFEQVQKGVPALMLWEEEKKLALKTVLKGLFSPKAIFVFIGPEGGFSLDEVKAARENGVVTVSLGPRVLRTETAGPACLSIILYEFGFLG